MGVADDWLEPVMVWTTVAGAVGNVALGKEFEVSVGMDRLDDEEDEEDTEDEEDDEEDEDKELVDALVDALVLALPDVGFARLVDVGLVQRQDTSCTKTSGLSHVVLVDTGGGVFDDDGSVLVDVGVVELVLAGLDNIQTYQTMNSCYYARCGGRDGDGRRRWILAVSTQYIQLPVKNNYFSAVPPACV